MQALPWLLIGAGVLAIVKALRDPGPLPIELREMTITSTGLPNKPPPEIWPALWRMLEFVQGLKKAHPGAVVTSVYRSPEVNRAVGGVEGSLHLIGRAVDFRLATDAETEQLFQSWQAEPWRIAGLISKVILYRDAVPKRFHLELAELGTAPDPKLIVRESVGIEPGGEKES